MEGGFPERCISGNTLFHPWRRRRRPQQRAVPRQRSWARQSQISERRGATPVGGPHPIRHGTHAGGGGAPSPALPVLGRNPALEPAGPTRGHGPSFRRPRRQRSSQFRRRDSDSYSPRCVRAQKEIVSDRLCGVIPAFCALRVS